MDARTKKLVQKYVKNYFLQAQKTQDEQSTTEITVPGLKKLGALKQAVKTLEASAETLEGEIKTRLIERFQRVGMAQGERPENLKGHEGGTEASLQLRKRIATSPLHPQEQRLMKQYNIPMEKRIKQPERFSLNPKYAGDKKILDKINKKLKEADLPSDLFLYQAEESSYTPSEDALDKIMALKDETVVETLLSFCSTIAIRFTATANPIEMREIIDDVL